MLWVDFSNPPCESILKKIHCWMIVKDKYTLRLARSIAKYVHSYTFVYQGFQFQIWMLYIPRCKFVKWYLQYLSNFYWYRDVVVIAFGSRTKNRGLKYPQCVDNVVLLYVPDAFPAISFVLKLFCLTSSISLESDLGPMLWFLKYFRGKIQQKIDVFYSK
jgi:hypothetical protein